jgi:hypothetical protein
MGVKTRRIPAGAVREHGKKLISGVTVTGDETH